MIFAIQKAEISPTYRYFLGSEDICVFLAYLQFWRSTDYLNIPAILNYWANHNMRYF
jgi:hypothetical protein